MGELTDFHFTTKYCRGKVNTDADALSRLLPDIDNCLNSCTEEVAMDTFLAVESSILEQQEGNINWITALSMSLNVLKDDLKYIESVRIDTISCDKIAAAQREDATIGQLIKWIESKERPTPSNKHQVNHTIHGFSSTSGTSWS